MTVSLVSAHQYHEDWSRASTRHEETSQLTWDSQAIMGRDDVMTDTPLNPSIHDRPKTACMYPHAEGFGDTGGDMQRQNQSSLASLGPPTNHRDQLQALVFHPETPVKLGHGADGISIERRNKRAIAFAQRIMPLT